MVAGIKVQTFKCERITSRRYVTRWSNGATMFHRTFKDAKERHDLIAGSLPNGSMLVASFVDCPKIKAEA